MAKKVLTDNEQRAVVSLCATLVSDLDAEIPDRVMDILEELPDYAELKRVKLYLRLIESPVVNLIISLKLKSFSDMLPVQKKQYLAGLARNLLLARLKVFRAQDTIATAIKLAVVKK